MGDYLLKEGAHNQCLPSSVLETLSDIMDKSTSPPKTREALFRLIQTTLKRAGWDKNLEALGLSLALNSKSPFGPYVYFVAA